MKSVLSRGILAALGAAFVAAPTHAQYQGFSQPSLMPATGQSAQYGGQYLPTHYTPPAEPEAVEPNLTPYTEESQPHHEHGHHYHGHQHGQPYSVLSEGCSSCGTGLYGDCTSCGVCNPWTFGVRGLIMTRTKPRFGQLSFDDTDPVGQVLSTDTGSMNWEWGIEGRIGYRFHQNLQLEGVYWGVFADSNETTVFADDLVGSLNTVFDFGPLNIGADNVNDLYDDAEAHRVRRHYEFHNIELNLLGGDLNGVHSCKRLNVTWLGGVRYFRLDENFLYSSADGSPVFGAVPEEEAHYNINVDNNLIGFQIGGRLDYAITNSLQAYVAPKVGIYNNHISHRSRIFNANGTAVVGPGNPLEGELFDIRTSDDVFSVLAEIDLGLNWQINRRWSANLGYRLVAVTDVALSTDQIPANFADIPGVADIDHSASLLLHGAYAGVEFRW